MMPTIEQVPWAYGGGAYYRGQNNPVAVVLHRLQGWATTARQWAQDGHSTASWHYTVGLDGSIMQHLAHSDGGYHAGINHEATGVPTWPLWKGSLVNVNKYTIGVECEGFEGGEWPRDQLASLKWLCERLASQLHIPYDRDHFPPHADINIRDRVNDFDRPERRHIVYDYLFGEEDMVDPRVDAILRFLGEADMKAWLDKGNIPFVQAFASEQTARGEATNAINAHIANHPGGTMTGVTADDIANAITGGAKFAADGIRFAAQRGSGG